MESGEREKALELYDYYQREIKELLNPTGVVRSSIIANKLSQWAKRGYNKEEIYEMVETAIFKYPNEEFVFWWNELKLVFDDRKAIVDKVIEFYMMRSKLSHEANDFYKKYASKEYLASKN